MSRVNIGDPGVFTAGSLPLGEHLLVARALDNRVGTFAAAETLRLLREQGVPEGIRVVAVSTVQEEVGLRGAAMIAESLAPDVALVTDVTHATDSPGINHAKHGKCVLGGGLKSRLVRRCTPKWFVDFLLRLGLKRLPFNGRPPLGVREPIPMPSSFVQVESPVVCAPCRFGTCTPRWKPPICEIWKQSARSMRNSVRTLAADFAQQGDAYQPFIPDYSS